MCSLATVITFQTCFLVEICDFIMSFKLLAIMLFLTSSLSHMCSGHQRWCVSACLPLHVSLRCNLTRLTPPHLLFSTAACKNTACSMCGIIKPSSYVRAYADERLCRWPKLKTRLVHNSNNLLCTLNSWIIFQQSKIAFMQNTCI